MIKIFTFICTFFLLSTNLHATLLADYHFDSCRWNGTPSEVIDHTGNYNGTRTAGDIQIQINSKLNNGASIPLENDISDVHAIDTRLTPMNIGNKGTILFWFKSNSPWNKGTGRTLFDASKGSKYFFLALTSDGKIKFYLEDKNDKDLQTCSKTFSFSANEWVHIAISWKLKASPKLYINGESKTLDIISNTIKSDSFGGLDSIHIGDIIRIYMQKDREHSANGIIDEFKIFDEELTETQIQNIFDNENLHHNYNGSHRMAIDCTTPVLVAEYRFDECKYTGAAGEVIDTTGGHNGTITGNAGVSKNKRKVGYALQLNGGAVDIEKLPIVTDPYKKNTVMFWMYWDKSYDTIPFGWQMYNLRFSKTLFGFNSSKDDFYGIANSQLANGWHHITAVFTNNDIHSNRLYIDGSAQSLSQQGNPSSQATATPSARIGGWRNDNKHRFTSHLDELKIYKGELNATTIATIYNNEKDLIRTLSCTKALLNAVDRKNGCFHWDNNITTKIAGKNIALTILASNETNTPLTDVNITKLELLSFHDTACKTHDDTTVIWSGNEKIHNGCFNPNLFTHKQAVRCAKIRITAIQNAETIVSTSSDTFSIRPKTFMLKNLPSGKLTAENLYTFKAIAVNADGTAATTNYTTTVTPIARKYFKDGSNGSTMAGSFSPTIDFDFTDGTSIDTNLSFNNVGIIGLNLVDTTWTVVDSDDTPLEQRTIAFEQNLTFIPKRFAIIFDAPPTMSNYLDGAFTYYANDLIHMGANLQNLSFKIKALGAHNGIMTNYQNTQTKWYANNTDFTLTLDVDQNPILSSDINESQIKDLNFTAGIATITYADLRFNFGRERNTTQKPRTTTGTNTKISIIAIDSIDHEVNASIEQTFNGDATFYYGKVIADDIKTGSVHVQATQKIEIYSQSPLTGFEQESLLWYLNKKDNFSIIGYRDENNRKLSDTSTTNQTVTNGKTSFTITANPTDKSYKKFYHLSIDPWLWYSKYEDYNFTNNNTCASHPCFQYIFEATKKASGIKSGHFKGAVFDNNFTTAPKRKAVKILR